MKHNANVHHIPHGHNMNVEDFSNLLVASQAGTVASERMSESEGTSIYRGVLVERLGQSRRRAERACGVGTVENQTQESTPDRDGDGRRLPSWDTLQNSRCAPEKTQRSMDPTGQTGRQLDLLG